MTGFKDIKCALLQQSVEILVLVYQFYDQNLGASALQPFDTATLPEKRIIKGAHLLSDPVFDTGNHAFGTIIRRSLLWLARRPPS